MNQQEEHTKVLGESAADVLKMQNALQMHEHRTPEEKQTVAYKNDDDAVRQPKKMCKEREQQRSNGDSQESVNFCNENCCAGCFDAGIQMCEILCKVM